MGFDHLGGQEAAQKKQIEQMRAVCEIEGGTSAYFKKFPLIDQVRIHQVEKRSRIYGKKGSL